MVYPSAVKTALIRYRLPDVPEYVAHAVKLLVSFATSEGGVREMEATTFPLPSISWRVQDETYPIYRYTFFLRLQKFCRTKVLLR